MTESKDEQKTTVLLRRQVLLPRIQMRNTLYLFKTHTSNMVCTFRRDRKQIMQADTWNKVKTKIVSRITHELITE